MKSQSKLLLLLSCIALSIPSAAFGVDYDRDGTEDLEVIEVNRPRKGVNRGTTKWTVRLSKTGRRVVHTFKVPGDAYFHFRRSDGKIYPGVVWVKDSTLPLLWFVKARRGESRFEFGEPGDTIPNQQDLDGDGVTDPVVVRATDNDDLQWFARFSKSGNVIQSTLLGNDGDRVGIGSDGMLFAVNSNFEWFGKFFAESSPTFGTQLGAAGDIPLFGLRSGQVAVGKGDSSPLSFSIRESDGSTRNETLSGVVFPFLTRFSGDALGIGGYDRSRKIVTLKNLATGRTSRIRFGASRAHLMLPTGQVIPNGNSGRFGNGGGGSSGGSGTPPSNPGLQAVCPTVRDALSSEIWKAIASTHIPASDPRRFSTSFIVRAGTPGAGDNCIEVYDSRGNQVHALGQYYPTGSSYSSRHYGGSGCGDKKGPQAVAAEAIANTGFREVYLKIRDGVCVRIPDPTGCVNSSQC